MARRASLCATHLESGVGGQSEAGIGLILQVVRGALGWWRGVGGGGGDFTSDGGAFSRVRTPVTALATSWAVVRVCITVLSARLTIEWMSLMEVCTA